MNCVIPGPNLKVLGKAIQALAKVGDEIYLEATEAHFALRTVNISTTVFGVIKFLSPFFTHYKINNVDTQLPISQKEISCKMPTKALLSVFKLPLQMEKQVEICKIELTHNPTKITFKFRYKNDVSKTQNIWLLDGDESLQVSLLNDPILNKISANSALYTQALSNFQTSDGEVSIDVSPQKIVLRNYIEGEITKIHHVRSQISLSPAEFTVYKIYKNATITFALKSFRAAIHFAETFNLGISLTFQQPGKPIEVTISNNITVEANFILATMNPESADTQSTTTTTTVAPSVKQSRKTIDPPEKPADKTIEPAAEINNIKNMNWDNIQINTDVDDPEPIIIPNSPESPRTKKIKYHFKRCFEPTYNGTMLDDDEILAGNSDPECEELLKN